MHFKRIASVKSNFAYLLHDKSMNLLSNSVFMVFWRTKYRYPLIRVVPCINFEIFKSNTT